LLPEPTTVATRKTADAPQVAPLAAPTDASLLLWLARGHDTSAASDSDVDFFALGGSGPSDSPDPAAVWEDDAWISHLGKVVG
jgi:hypothetical protein